MMTDPIADMLTRIRNGQAARKKMVEMPFSVLKFRLAQILSAEGYVGTVEKRDGTPAVLIVELLYRGKQPVIRTITRESAPGHRQYRKADAVPTVVNGYGMAILSTSHGLMTDRDARAAGIGGEFICSVF